MFSGTWFRAVKFQFGGAAVAPNNCLPLRGNVLLNKAGLLLRNLT